MRKNREIKVFRTAVDLYDAAALNFSQYAQATVKKKGIFSVALSGGQTPKLFYQTLSCSSYCMHHTPWDNIRFFFGDERYVPPTDLNSNYHTAFEFLFSKVPVNPENIFPIPTHYPDPVEAAYAYENTLHRAFQLSNHSVPQFDLIYLGLGDNAHTASLMPCSNIVIHYAHDVSSKSPQPLVSAVSTPETSLSRITLTPTVINRSRRILFMVSGHQKAQAICNVLNAPYDPITYPAQLIQCQTGQTLWYLDQPAAALLKDDHDNPK